MMTTITINGRNLNDHQSAAFRLAEFVSITDGTEKQNAFSEQVRHEHWLGLAARLAAADTAEKAVEYVTKIVERFATQPGNQFWIRSKSMSRTELVSTLGW